MLNVLAVAGFMTFWAKCNTRSVQAVGPEAAADAKRPRGNGTAQGASISHEVLLKRLSSLEDVVYRQLNGTAQCKHLNWRIAHQEGISKEVSLSHDILLRSDPLCSYLILSYVLQYNMNLMSGSSQHLPCWSGLEEIPKW